MSWLTLLRWLVRQRRCPHHNWNDVVRGDGAAYRVCRDCGRTL